MKQQRPQRKTRSLFRLVFSLVTLLVAVWIIWHRQVVIDQLAVWRFHPSAEVAALAERSMMTDEGKHFFYASSPQIQDRNAFNDSCNTARGEQTVVLGCYTAQRIYLFNVVDEKLNGIKEVTAAHEMLHAVYERLNTSERNRINNLIEAQLPKISDERIQTLIQEYEKTEPGEKLNELHSILATEVNTLSPDLEAYYSQYFKDRHAVVALSQRYESIFAGLKNAQEQLASELEQLASELNAESDAYNKGISRLNADIATFNARAEAGDFSSQSQFNNERNALVSRQEQLRVQQTALENKIAIYNQKRKELEATNSQAEALNRSINSNLSPVPSI